MYNNHTWSEADCSAAWECANDYSPDLSVGVVVGLMIIAFGSIFLDLLGLKWLARLNLSRASAWFLRIVLISGVLIGLGFVTWQLVDVTRCSAPLTSARAVPLMVVAYQLESLVGFIQDVAVLTVAGVAIAEVANGRSSFVGAVLGNAVATVFVLGLMIPRFFDITYKSCTFPDGAVGYETALSWFGDMESVQEYNPVAFLVLTAVMFLTGLAMLIAALVCCFRKVSVKPEHEKLVKRQPVNMAATRLVATVILVVSLVLWLIVFILLAEEDEKRRRQIIQFYTAMCFLSGLRQLVLGAVVVLASRCQSGSA